jgi:tetratricopeptide (TPR) repeat protein
MSSTTPTIKQIAWISIIPQLFLMGFFIFSWHLLSVHNPFLNGSLTYLALSWSLRYFIPSAHRKGMSLVKKENFQEAIPFFEKSYDFFKMYDWLDKYRFVTLLSSSKISYKEMALNNIAFCYGQIGDGYKSKEFYERTLVEFPDSGLAKAGLRLLNSMNKNG